MEEERELHDVPRAKRAYRARRPALVRSSTSYPTAAAYQFRGSARTPLAQSVVPGRAVGWPRTLFTSALADTAHRSASRHGSDALAVTPDSDAASLHLTTRPFASSNV